MTDQETMNKEMIGEVWRTYLTTGEMPDYIGAPWYTSKRLRSFYLHLPNNPRCRVCYYPFKGIGGSIMRRVFGITPSKLNPHICNQCEQFLEKFQGGAEVELTILFVDVRGSTRLAEEMNPTEFSQLINRFYNATTNVLFEYGAMVEKIAGDAVTGFFTPGFTGSDHAHIAIEAARKILVATGNHGSLETSIPVGIGIHTGRAYVGAVNSDFGISDIAVLGDTANIGARLTSLARKGEILISKETARAAHLDNAGVEIRTMELKGRNQPVEVWVL